jgi:uncharacterized membrane protein YfcA
MVPALLLVGGFSAAAAVALSNTTILAASLANLAYNAPRRSPVRAVGPLIDWDLVLLFGPPTVAGSIAGSHINMVIPGWCALASGFGFWLCACCCFCFGFGLGLLLFLRLRLALLFLCCIPLA